MRIVSLVSEVNNSLLGKFVLQSLRPNLGFEARVTGYTDISKRDFRNYPGE